MAQIQVEPAPVEESAGVFGRLFGNLRTGARPVDASKVAQLLTPPTTPKSITIALSDSASPLNTVSSSATSCSCTLLTSTCRRRVVRRAALLHYQTRRTRRLALHSSSERALFAGRRMVLLAGVSSEFSHRLCICIPVWSPRIVQYRYPHFRILPQPSKRVSCDLIWSSRTGNVVVSARRRRRCPISRTL
jgi:hypothetical protein